ncbi:class I SAM-dependent methyltransferase [Micromonospora sp. WMMD1082]|uniref:class I SAM-dependent methyltransferase n=1 Tax=Micromonospora sp. WMMD1082 TaxID=3016104 RepID=UPI002415EBA4|nr:class I SAM-dependent methyltransferase [Micromonospora sp. WMMD1082]MDG4797335.1 class I SAM-dependent methyltransferase [Micromonospora sp. WMMD1082]
MSKARVNGEVLEGVAATSLWTLRNRAVEAMNPRSDFEDPWSVRLYESIDYDFDRFGRPSQSHPLRAGAIDAAVRGYLAAHPAATIVALGEGLQTTYWRTGRPDVDWLSVDAAAVLDVRARLLPPEPRIIPLAVSALDRSWRDRVDPARGVLIVAEGLFMYLPPAEVLALIADCAQRFPGGQLIFDSIPAWFSRRTLAGLNLSDRYTAPPMPFHLSVTEAGRLATEIPQVVRAVDVALPPGRGLWRSRVLRRLSNLPPLRDRRPSLTLLTFAGHPGEARRATGRDLGGS